MSAAPVDSELPIYKQITNDLSKAYKDILIKYLDERILKEDKVYIWINNILNDAKNYFVQKYPDYDLFIFINVCPINIYFYSGSYSISSPNIDWCNYVCLKTDHLYCSLFFFFYKHYDLNYNIDEHEALIIQEGNEILKNILKDKKFGNDCKKYNKKINSEHPNYVVQIEDKLRCLFINEIYQNPIQGKYYFKYLSHGKDIYSKIFQTYDNDSLTCNHYLFFFK